jgi:hypothetical protein
VRRDSGWRPRATWLLSVAVGSAVVALVLSGRAPKDADPKWELAIRSGMPFVSVTLVPDRPPLSPSQVFLLKGRLDGLFERAFLEPGTGNYLVLSESGPQTWLKPRGSVDLWRAFHLVISPSQKTVLRCYPRFEGMTWYDPDFYVESQPLEAGSWYQVRIFVQLFRQLTKRPLLDFRIDFIPRQSRLLSIADLYVEGRR